MLRALDTGLIDAVQVVYNLFDQNPEDELFPACREKNIAVIARVPFDEGSLTGTLTANSRWPDGDFRNIYFRPENLTPTLSGREAAAVGPGRHDHAGSWRCGTSCSIPTVSTVIPGMRKLRHVEENIAASDGQKLPEAVMAELKRAPVGRRWISSDRGR